MTPDIWLSRQICQNVTKRLQVSRNPLILYVTVKVKNKPILGIHVDNLLKIHKEYPSAKWTMPYAAKYNYDHMRFRMAMSDMWWGRWEASDLRSPKCDFIMPPNMEWMRFNKIRAGSLNSERKPKSVKPPKPEKRKKPSDFTVRRGRDQMAKAGGYTLLSVMNETDGLCPCCHVDMIGRYNYELDHIMPLALGGDNRWENVWFLCTDCNRRKSAKDPYVWADENSVVLPDKFLEQD